MFSVMRWLVICPPVSGKILFIIVYSVVPEKCGSFSIFTLQEVNLFSNGKWKSVSIEPR